MALRGPNMTEEPHTVRLSPVELALKHLSMRRFWLAAGMSEQDSSPALCNIML